MAYQIYWIAGSPYSWRALLGLQIKGLDYESKLLQASKGEHQTAEFLQINPRGRVPVLRDNDKTIYESIAILAYLDRKHPQPSLFGSSAEETGMIWQRIFEIENYVHDPVSAIVRPVYFDQTKEKMVEINEALKTVYSEFALIDAVLGENNFYIGSKISAVDLALFPLVMSLQRALSLENGKALELNFLPFEERYPNIASWIQRIEAIPGYEKTYPPNWSDT